MSLIDGSLNCWSVMPAILPSRLPPCCEDENRVIAEIARLRRKRSSSGTLR